MTQEAITLSRAWIFERHVIKKNPVTEFLLRGKVNYYFCDKKKSHKQIENFPVPSIDWNPLLKSI